MTTQEERLINETQTHAEQTEAFYWACSSAAEYILDRMSIYYGDDLETAIIKAVRNPYDLKNLLPETFDEHGQYALDGEYDPSIIDFVTDDNLRECRMIVADVLIEHGVE